MAWTNVGFDGTINEAQWSALAGLLGNGYVAAGNGDCVVTAVSGARSVSVAAGSLYGDGVLSTNSGAETVAMTTPVNGQWYVIALRRTWASNSAALVAIAGATTTTTTPTAPPTSFPTLNTNVGVLTDQPIAWAWCNSANTTVVVYDIRLKAVKSLPPVVANANERDAKFMSPTQGLQVWRDDLGAVETYFGLYNASTNPGGRDAAGWYSTSRVNGLVPIQPSSVVVATGTATANSLGAVNFTGATSVSLNGVFSSAYQNYRIVTNIYGVGATTDIFMRLRSAGTDKTSATYTDAGFYANISTLSNNYRTAATNAMVSWTTSGLTANSIRDIFRPYVTDYTQWSNHSVTGNSLIVNHSGTQSENASYDGFTTYIVSGVFSGTIQVFGYND